MILFFFVFFISLIFFLFFKKIVKKVNIYDSPDGIRKFQNKKVSCVGGLYFFVIILAILLYCIFFNQGSREVFQIFQFQNYKEIVLFFFTATVLFLIGLYDDKYLMNPTIKTVLLLSTIFFYVYHVDKIQINEIRSILFVNEIYIGNLSIFFTLLCFFSFLIASNMFDGSNGQSFLNFTSIFIFLIFKGLFFDLSVLFILMLLFFSIYNFKNLVYLGDSGVYFLSFILAYLVVVNYNYDQSMYVEEIVIILLIPILDMVRLFATRTIEGKNPFMSDATHIHHVIKTKYGSKKLIYILTLIIMLPLLTLITLNINYYFIIISQLLVYVYFVFIVKKK